MESPGLVEAFEGSYASSIVLGNKLAAPLVQVLEADKCCLECVHISTVFESPESCVVHGFSQFHTTDTKYAPGLFFLKKNKKLKSNLEEDWFQHTRTFS